MQPESLPQIVSRDEEDKIPAPTWKMVKNLFFPKASDEMVAYYFRYCAKAQMDPQLKPFAIVSIPQKNDAPDKEDIWPTIVFYRMIAHRTGEYAGLCNWELGPTIDHVFDFGKSGGKRTISFPEWGRVTVRRFVKSINQMVEYELPKMYWIETAPLNKWGCPTPMWQKKPFAQFNKCLEAAALRLGFPEIGNDQTVEEQSRHQGFDDAITINPTETETPSGNGTVQRRSPLERMQDQRYDGPVDASGKPIQHDEDGVIREKGPPLIEHQPEQAIQMDLIPSQKEMAVLRPVEDLTTPGQFVEEFLLVDIDMGTDAWPRLDRLTKAWNGKVEAAEAKGKSLSAKAKDNVSKAIADATKRLEEGTDQEAETAPTGEAHMETLVDIEHRVTSDALTEEQLG